MRKLITLIIIIIACNLNTSFANGNTIFKGSIKNLKSGKIELLFINNPIDSNYSILNINLDKEGGFYESYQLDKAIAARLVIVNDTIPIYLDVADTIEFNYVGRNHIDVKSKYDNIKYLIEYEALYLEEINRIVKKSDKYEFRNFAKELDFITYSTLTDLKEFSLKNKLSSSFITYQKAKYTYNSANKKFDYFKKHDMLSIIYENLPENEVYLFYDKLSDTQSDLLLLNEYRQYLLNKHQYKYAQSNNNNLTVQEQMNLKFRLVTEMYMGRELYFVITMVMGDILDQYTYIYAKLLISEYMSTVRNHEYRSYIDNKIQLAIRRLE
jgi:hypothetical protein